MFESIDLCDASVPELLVVVRLGSNILLAVHPAKRTAECHARWGMWGFVFLEVPGGDYGALNRLRPAVTTRRPLLVAHGADLIASGFPLLPTLDAPHWTVTPASPITEALAAVRSHFDGPIENPVWFGRTPPVPRATWLPRSTTCGSTRTPSAATWRPSAGSATAHAPTTRPLTPRPATGSPWEMATRLRSGLGRSIVWVTRVSVHVELGSSNADVV